MITAQDIALHRAALPIVAAAPVPAVEFRERLLLIVLYITVLASSVALIEPSPHDALMGALAVASVVAGVRFERKAALLILLLLVWNAAGLISLLNVPAEQPAIQYVATSFYLAIAALIFACLFAQNTMPRLATMRAAYILTAILTTLFGIAAYMHLVPGEDTFIWAGRVRSTFKDPNVFGPFLILPTLLLVEGMITRGIKLHHLVATAILLIGLLYSFSRGAWLHFAVSTVVMLTLLVLTSPTRWLRMRVLGVSVAVTVGIGLLLVVLASVSPVREMLFERGQVFQSYDVGEGGRFRLQELALGALLDHPAGMGAFEFARIHGLQQHNVYLQAFMVYGWLGGITYIALVLVSLVLGLRTVFVRTPWQPYLIVAFAAFVGEAVEGLVIDSDHWRHFYLILGMLWGLATATVKSQGTSKQEDERLAWSRSSARISDNYR